MLKLLGYFSVNTFMFVLLSCDTAPITANSWIHISSKEGGIPAPGPSTQQTACLILDVDKDGINDFIVGSRVTGPSIIWYRRNEVGWTTYVIDRSFLPIEAGGAFHDIDGDGDLDIVFGSDSQGNEVWWWENPYPDYRPTTPWTRHEVKNSGPNKHHDEIFGDFDGDGEVELVFGTKGQISFLLRISPKILRQLSPGHIKRFFRALLNPRGWPRPILTRTEKLTLWPVAPGLSTEAEAAILPISSIPISDSPEWRWAS